MEQYIWKKSNIHKTLAERISDTVEFFRKKKNSEYVIHWCNHSRRTWLNSCVIKYRTRNTTSHTHRLQHRSSMITGYNIRQGQYQIQTDDVGTTWNIMTPPTHHVKEAKNITNILPCKTSEGAYIVPGYRWNILPPGTMTRFSLPARQRLKPPLE